MMEQNREEELRRLATIVRDSNDAILLIDFNGNIRAWNRGAERIYGYSEAEALKMNIMELLPPDMKEKSREMLKKLQRGEEVSSFETKRTTKDGRILDIWLTITTLRDDQGKPYMVATTERDITQIKRTEESLRASNEELKVSEEELKANIEELNSSEEQLREKVEELKATEAPLSRLATVVRDSNDAIILTDIDGKILAWNRGAERMYGYREEEALGMNLLSIVPKGERLRDAEIMDRLRAGIEVPSFETRRRAKDGRVIVVWLAVTVLKDEHGQPYAIATTERDLTELGSLRRAVEELQDREEQLRTAYEELEVVNEELGTTNSELNSTIDDLKELNLVLGVYYQYIGGRLRAHMDLIQGFTVPSAGTPERDRAPGRGPKLEAIREEIGMARSDLNDFSLVLQAYTSDVHFNRIDLTAIAQSITEELERADPGSKVRVSIAKGLFASADRDMIRSALKLLLANSWEHVHNDPEGKIIFIFSHKPTGSAFLISDNRRVVDRPRIERSLELAKSLKYGISPGDLDIGLGMGRKIIERNGGHLWAHFSQGRGVEFEFTLNIFGTS